MSVKFSLEKNIRKTSKVQIPFKKTDEKVKCNLCDSDVNKYTYQLHLKSIKHLLKTGEKQIDSSSVKNFWYWLLYKA